MTSVGYEHVFEKSLYLLICPIKEVQKIVHG